MLDELMRRRGPLIEQRVGAYAVCVEDGEVLLARFSARGQQFWTLPGGGLDHGEDPFGAVVREVAEETGYTVEVERLLGVNSARRHHPRGRGRVADHHHLRVIYAARVTGGELRPEVGGTTDLAAWVALNRLDELAPRRAELIDIGLELARDRPPSGHVAWRPGAEQT